MRDGTDSGTNPIVGSDEILVHTATSDKEAATALGVYLLTNFFGSVRCVVHTLTLPVNDVFESGTVWKKYLDHVNEVTTYFNHHQKAAQLLAMKQLEDGVTPDRLQRFKHDIPIRWHSRLAALSVYLSRLENITAVAVELSIDSAATILICRPTGYSCRFITVLAEVRRVTRQLESNRKVTMSRAPRLPRELHETLLIMTGTLLPSSAGLLGSQPTALHLEELEDAFDLRALPVQPINAIADGERDEARMILLQKNHPKALAIRFADRVKTRLGYIWQQVDSVDVLWQPDGEKVQEPDREMHQLRRVLLFHISAMVDVNEL